MLLLFFVVNGACKRFMTPSLLDIPLVPQRLVSSGVHNVCGQMIRVRVLAVTGGMRLSMDLQAVALLS